MFVMGLVIATPPVVLTIPINILDLPITKKNSELVSKLKIGSLSEADSEFFWSNSWTNKSMLAEHVQADSPSHRAVLIDPR